MNEKTEEKENPTETNESWWSKVYLSVIVVTILVLSALGAFSAYFR